MKKMFPQPSVSSGSFLTLEEVSNAFGIWRESKSPSDSIPDDLWYAAIALTSSYPRTRICKELRLSYSDFKKRLDECSVNRSKISACPGSGSPSVFVELPRAGSQEESVIELENGKGARLKMTCRGQSPLNILSFWQMLLASQS